MIDKTFEVKEPERIVVAFVPRISTVLLMVWVEPIENVSASKKRISPLLAAAKADAIVVYTLVEPTGITVPVNVGKDLKV